MAKITIPQQGQPLDLSYIASIATAVNELFEIVANRGATSAVIDDPNSAVKTTLKASEVKMVGGYKEVANNASVNAGNTKAFTYDFVTQFKYPPIVSVTPVNINNSTSGKNVSVTLSSVTTSRVEGIVNFNVTGNAAVGVHIVAIGVPV